MKSAMGLVRRTHYWGEDDPIIVDIGWDTRKFLDPLVLRVIFNAVWNEVTWPEM